MAENLTARARGLGDVGTRRLGPQGLAIDAQTAALSRLTGGPSMGPAHITGRVTELKPGWRFAGQVQAAKLELGAYSLAQAGGPLEVTSKSGEWGVKTRLAGSGGRGTGFVAAAMGAAPKASFDGSRLPDGRLAMRELVLTGAGVKLEASGGRSLLGGLTFKGKAAVSNLAAARAGAAGSASATWSAAQSKAGQPWTLTADARGDRFATGFAEVDRLLGSKPQLKAQANVLGRRVSVGSASLQGAALKASTAGVLAEDGGLTFKLDWRASGAVRAGPGEM
jgi:translocation and assembly module TamB